MPTLARVQVEEQADVYRRALDVVVSAIIGLVIVPLIVATAIGSAVTLRAWPFFVQDRIGRHGETFRFVKIRTLPLDVPRYTDKHQLANHDIPAFCRFLRTFHLDELPQVYLVLAGHMSLVGPRPEMGTLHDRMHPSFADERTAVRPGCTGLWQISCACTDLISAAPEFDRFYLAHRSARFDLWVLGRTLLKMTGLGSTIALDQVPSWALKREAGEVYVLDLTSLEHDAELADAPMGLSVGAQP